MRSSAWILPVAVLGSALWVACSSSDSSTTPYGAAGKNTGGVAGKAGQSGASGTGGASQGGSSGQGGSVGGNGGTGDGGTANGGTGNGGTANGGTGNGGTGNGGTANGGTGNGGTGNGGTAGADGGVGGTGGSANCTAITAKDFLANAKYTGAVGDVSPNIGAADPDILFAQLWEGTGFVMQPGTFDLSQGGDENFSTCHHCNMVYQDNAQGSTTMKTFFQESGSMVMTKFTSPLNGEIAAKLTNVKFIEVTIDDTTGVSTPVANGECLFLASTDINTIPIAQDAGTACANASECGSLSTMVCDPKTATCQPYQCDFAATPKPCAANEQCDTQAGASSVGACYPKCTPNTGTECGTAGQCMDVGWAGELGGCHKVGTGTAGAACAPAGSDLNTGCVAGYNCLSDGTNSACFQMCNFFSATPTCAAATDYCNLGGTCYAATGDPAAIGANCTTTENYCGLQGKSYRGFCLPVNGDAGATEVCRQLCRMSTPADCPTGKTCTQTFVNSSTSLPITDIGSCL